MKVEFGEVKVFQQDATVPSSGSFSLAHPVTWHRCREQFASKFTSETEGFYFGHTHGASIAVASFIAKTEHILSIANKFEKYSQFSLTNRPYAVWIQPSEFWKVCQIRRSLLTILLRCGIQYDVEKDNYEAALKSDKYALETQKAIRRFLFGYTKFNKPEQVVYSSYTGWRELFCNADVTATRIALQLPPEGIVEKTLIGSGSIWN